MSISVRCTSCGRGFALRDQYGGKRVRCPNCQGLIEVPAPTLNLVDDEDSSWLDGVDGGQEKSARDTKSLLGGGSRADAHAGEIPSSDGPQGSRGAAAAGPGPAPPSVSFQCHACGTWMQAAANLAGRLARCKQCRVELEIPSPVTSKPAPTRGTRSPTGRPSSAGAGGPAPAGHHRWPEGPGSAFVPLPPRSGAPGGQPPSLPPLPAANSWIDELAQPEASSESMSALPDWAAGGQPLPGSMAASGRFDSSARLKRPSAARKGPLINSGNRLALTITVAVAGLALLILFLVSPANAWRLLYFTSALTCVVGFFLVLVAVCRHENVGVALLCLAGLCVCNVGYFAAILLAYTHRHDWKLGPLGPIMAVATAVQIMCVLIGNPFVEQPANGVYAQLTQQMEEAREVLRSVGPSRHPSQSELHRLDLLISRIAEGSLQVKAEGGDVAVAFDEGVFGSNGVSRLARTRKALLREISSTQRVSALDVMDQNRLERLRQAIVEPSAIIAPTQSIAARDSVSSGAPPGWQAQSHGAPVAASPAAPSVTSAVRGAGADSAAESKPTMYVLEEAEYFPRPIRGSMVRQDFPDDLEVPFDDLSVTAHYRLREGPPVPSGRTEWVIRSRRNTDRGQADVAGAFGMISVDSRAFEDDAGPFEFWLEAAADSGPPTRISNIVTLMDLQDSVRSGRGRRHAGEPAPGAFSGDAANSEAASPFGDPGSVPSLAGQLRDPRALGDPQTRQLAIEAGDRQVVETVAAHLRDPRARADAVALLIAMGPQVEEVLWRYLEDSDVEVQRQACRILGRVGTAASLPKLKRLSSDKRLADDAFAAWSEIRKQPARSR